MNQNIEPIFEQFIGNMEVSLGMVKELEGMLEDLHARKTQAAQDRQAEVFARARAA